MSNEYQRHFWLWSARKAPVHSDFGQIIACDQKDSGYISILHVNLWNTKKEASDWCRERNKECLSAPKWSLKRIQRFYPVKVLATVGHMKLPQE